MRLGNSMMKTKKAAPRCSDVSRLRALFVLADYSKKVRKTFGISNMLYWIRTPNRIEGYSIRYSKFSNIFTPLIFLASAIIPLLYYTRTYWKYYKSDWSISRCDRKYLVSIVIADAPSADTCKVDRQSFTVRSLTFLPHKWDFPSFGNETRKMIWNAEQQSSGALNCFAPSSNRKKEKRQKGENEREIFTALPGWRTGI